MNSINYSIIIPHKNIPNLLQRCLDSIPRRKDIQIIVVDDNSDSNIVDFNHFPGMNENNIEIIYTKEGKGAGYARNVGLKHAKGKWLLFADADDFYCSNTWNILDNYQNSNNDIIYFGVDCVNSNTLQPTDRGLKNNENIKNYINKTPNSEKFIRYRCWEPWNKMYSHNFIKQNHLTYEEIIRGNDAMFVLKAGYLAKQITALDNKLYTVTFRTNSISYTPTKENMMSAFLLKIRMNNFFRSIKEPSFQISVWYDIKHVYQLFGIKEALKFIKIGNSHNAHFIYFIFNDKEGLIRLTKKIFRRIFNN
ncbi:MAG: glycosyltransferase [Bacteroidaceae bacterium]|nr:glycosyltransferase [Bacteroidaceae bacterium]